MSHLNPFPTKKEAIPCFLNFSNGTKMLLCQKTNQKSRVADKISTTVNRFTNKIFPLETPLSNTAKPTIVIQLMFVCSLQRKSDYSEVVVLCAD